MLFLTLEANIDWENSKCKYNQLHFNVCCCLFANSLLSFPNYFSEFSEVLVNNAESANIEQENAKSVCAKITLTDVYT